MKNFFMRYWWLWTVVIFSVLPMVFFEYQASYPGLINQEETGLTGDFKKFYKADPWQEGLVVLKNRDEAKEYHCFEIDYSLHKGKVVSFSCKDGAVRAEGPLGRKRRVFAGLSIKYDGPKSSVDSVMDAIGYTIKFDSGFVYPYPAFDGKDSLWAALDSIEKAKAEAWRRGSRTPWKPGEGFMKSVLVGGYSRTFVDEWVAFEAITVTESKEMDSLVNRSRGNIGGLYDGTLRSVPGLPPSGYETELTFEVKYDAAKKKQTARILNSTTPNAAFEKSLIEMLEYYRIGLPKEAFEKSFRIISKYYIFKTEKFSYDCLGDSVSANSLCDVSLVGRREHLYEYGKGVFEGVFEEDSLNFNCKHVFYRLYRGSVIDFDCRTGKETREERLTKTADMSLIYDGSLDHLLNLWIDSDYRINIPKNMEDSKKKFSRMVQKPIMLQK